MTPAMPDIGATSETDLPEGLNETVRGLSALEDPFAGPPSGPQDTNPVSPAATRIGPPPVAPPGRRSASSAQNARPRAGMDAPEPSRSGVRARGVVDDLPTQDSSNQTLLLKVPVEPAPAPPPAQRRAPSRANLPAARPMPAPASSAPYADEPVNQTARINLKDLNTHHRPGQAAHVHRRSGEGEVSVAVRSAAVTFRDRWTTLPESQKRVVIAVGGLGVVVVGLVAVLTGGSRVKQMLRRGPDPQVVAIVDKGRKALLDHRFDEAKSAFDAAKALGAEEQGIELDVAFKVAAQGKADAKVLAEATDALEAGKLEVCKKLLDGISSESELRAEVLALRAKMPAMLGKSLLNDAKAALASHDVAKARSLHDQLATIDADAAKALKVEIDGAGPASGGSRPTAGGHADVKADARPAPFAAAFAAASMGEWTRAAEAFEAVKEAPLKAEAATKAAACRACAKGFASADRPTTDLIDLVETHDACAKVDRNATQVKQLRERIVKQGNQAGDLAMGAGRYDKAARYYRAALTVDSEDIAANSGLKKLGEHVQELYQQGYVLRESDPGGARQIFRAVLQVTQPGDEYHEKAKNRLSEAAGGQR